LTMNWLEAIKTERPTSRADPHPDQGAFLRLAITVFAIHSSRPWMAATGMVLYAGLACLCAVAWRKARRDGLPAAARGWGVVAMGQLFLGADAAFGIRLVLAEASREFFVQHGWYEQRWFVQAILSAATLMTCVTGWMVLGRVRKMPLGVRLALGGLLLSLLLFLIAVVSMHRLEVLLAWPFEPLALGTSMRAAACVLTATGAWKYLRGGGIVAAPPP
jgi:hypothetical protein